MTEEENTIRAEAPKGRAAYMAFWKEQNPESENEPSDDDMYDHAIGGWNSHKEISGKYDALNGAHERLAQVMSEDPRFAEFFGMVAQGENPMYAMGKIFGDAHENMDDEGLENLRKGQEEYKANFAKIKGNYDNYRQNIQTYVSENGLTPEQADQLDETIWEIGEAFMERDVPTEIIDLVWKGLDADAQKEAMTEAEKLQVRNETIAELKDAKANDGKSPMADIGGGNKVQKPVTTGRKFEDDEPVDYSQRLKKKA